MKTKNSNNTLNFTKSSISELNDQQLLGVHGGDAITITYVYANGEKILFITYAQDKE